MSSNSTKRIERAFTGIAESRSQVQRTGRSVSAASLGGDSFWVAPVDVAPLVDFPQGVAAALEAHLAGQGLTDLAGEIAGLEKLGTRMRRTDRADLTVSDTVYQMH